MESILVYFVRGDGDLCQYKEQSLTGYRPLFLHQLFPEEVLYGYEDLEVHLVYDVASLHVLLQVRYSRKDSCINGFVDVETRLYEHLPNYVFTNLELFEQEHTRVSFMDKYLSSWQVASQKPYSGAQVYVQNVTDPSAFEIYNIFKLLLLFYIETASYIDCKDDKWDIFVISGFQGEILGFATVYRFTCFDPVEKKWSTRVRIAQFLIFPCFQGKGFGLTLLDAIYSHYLQTGCCFEITVECPCEAFQTLRDVLDTQNCLQLERKLGYLPSVEEIREYWKITRKQAFRCREIIQFSRLENEEQVKAFRLQVKKRLLSEYAEVLKTESIVARKESLWRLYKEIEETYRKVWKSVVR